MKEVMLALIEGGRSYGYDLSQSFRGEFGNLLPQINGGQIYTTLARLEKDRLIEGREVPGDRRGKREFALTPAGREHLERWIARPVDVSPLKDEFFIKFIVVVSGGLAAPQDLLDQQREMHLRSLRDLDALLESRATTTTSMLMVEGAILHVKADLEWLDMIELHLSTKESQL